MFSLKSSLFTLSLTLILFVLGSTSVFAYSSDTYFRITNNTGSPLQIFTSIDYEQETDGIDCSYTTGGCTIGPGKTLLGLHFMADVPCDGNCSNRRNDQPTDAEVRIWGLNGVVLYYTLGNGNGDPPNYDSINAHTPPLNRTPAFPFVQDHQCAYDHDNDHSTLLVAYVPPANATPYPDPATCASGYTAAGPICMKFNYSDDIPCWHNDTYFVIQVNSDLPTHRSTPTSL